MTIRVPLFLAVALMSLTGAAMQVVETPAGTLLERALSCRISDDDIPTLMAMLSAEDVGMKTPIQAFALPSGNLYHLSTPANALGYSTRDIYVAPGRILMAVSGQTLDAVIAEHGLAPVPLGPAEAQVVEGRKVIAYQLHQQNLADKALIGCEYDNPGAAAWLGQDGAGL